MTPLASETSTGLSDLLAELESVHAKLRVAEDTMRDKGWWENSSGYLTDAAIWIDRARDEIAALLRALIAESATAVPVNGPSSPREEK